MSILSPTPASLVITAGATGVKLSAKQKEFNRLVARVERLRSQLAATTTEFDACLQYYAAHIAPIEAEDLAARADLARAAYKFWPPTMRLAAKLRKQLRVMLLEMLDGLLNGSPNDAVDLIAIEKALSGDDYVPPEQRAELERAEENAALRAMLAAFAKQSGMPIDLSKLPADPTPEDFARMVDDARSASEEPANKTAASGEPKRNKQAEAAAQRQRAVEDAKQRSISVIYKQLARLLHPDLEQDPALRIQKETLMKRVTGAYQAGDLHTLLSLELEWLQGEGQDVGRLTNEKLAVYNEVLRDQIAELEVERTMLLGHPRYHVMHKYFAGPKDVKLKRLQKQAIEVRLGCESIQACVRGLAEPDAVRVLTGLLAQWSRERRMEATYGVDHADFFA
jgi:hypothetical protein